MKKLVLVVDMYGCPNQCRHCWLGAVKHTHMPEGSDEKIVDYFKPYFDQIEFYSWLREPDFTDDYEARWEKDKRLSIGTQPQRFELASFYRLCRDNEYVHFLKKVGVKEVQLTFFGMEDTTDRYVGRKGAFQELLSASALLAEHGITPRYQAFINEENKEEIVQLLEYLKGEHRERRYEEKGIPFNFFVHEGSCDGENRKLYPIRIAKNNIPKPLVPHYLGYDDLYSEKECCEMLKNERSSHVYHNEDVIVLNVTSDLSVYYHFTNITDNWKIGNILEETAEDLVHRILSENTFALNKAREITLGELVERYGDIHSDKAFSLEDYKAYLLNEHIESLVR